MWIYSVVTSFVILCFNCLSHSTPSQKQVNLCLHLLLRNSYCRCELGWSQLQIHSCSTPSEKQAHPIQVFSVAKVVKRWRRTAYTCEETSWPFHCCVMMIPIFAWAMIYFICSAQGQSKNKFSSKSEHYYEQAIGHSLTRYSKFCHAVFWEIRLLCHQVSWILRKSSLACNES